MVLRALKSLIKKDNQPAQVTQADGEAALNYWLKYAQFSEDFRDKKYFKLGPKKSRDGVYRVAARISQQNAEAHWNGVSYSPVILPKARIAEMAMFDAHQT